MLASLARNDQFIPARTVALDGASALTSGCGHAHFKLCEPQVIIPGLAAISPAAPITFPTPARPGTAIGRFA
ncbi:hypothetical protein ACCAA_680028 [Candidatus Accumulibacter aalborgensis]|uniref:Uncharacterized protein n=1 Tax=Candidatus Accumulibacter aalborgensis TaxID=1860102 RepID=A0A1A8XWB6_9PROT|nr:hypothetical protein ACCAA_680028 [Candidatus Accumulibacter aalborgensis]